MMDRLDDLLLLAGIGYGCYLVWSFLVLLIKAPRGCFPMRWQLRKLQMTTRTTTASAVGATTTAFVRWRRCGERSMG